MLTQLFSSRKQAWRQIHEWFWDSPSTGNARARNRNWVLAFTGDCYVPSDAMYVIKSRNANAFRVEHNHSTRSIPPFGQVLLSQQNSKRQKQKSSRKRLLIDIHLCTYRESWVHRTGQAGRRGLTPPRRLSAAICARKAYHPLLFSANLRDEAAPAAMSRFSLSELMRSISANRLARSSLMFCRLDSMLGKPVTPK